jgi:hypothetical protein
MMGRYNNPEIIPPEFVARVSPILFTFRVMIFDDPRRTEDVADYAQELGIRPIRYLQSKLVSHQTPL